MCGDVKITENGLRNDYLGKLVDSKGKITSQVIGDSFLVEIGIRRVGENKKYFDWDVLKPHGKSVPNVHTVPLKVCI